MTRNYISLFIFYKLEHIIFVLNFYSFTCYINMSHYFEKMSATKLNGGTKKKHLIYLFALNENGCNIH